MGPANRPDTEPRPAMTRNWLPLCLLTLLSLGAGAASAQQAPMTPMYPPPTMQGMQGMQGLGGRQGAGAASDAVTPGFSAGAALYLLGAFPDNNGAFVTTTGIGTPQQLETTTGFRNAFRTSPVFWIGGTWAGGIG